MHKYTTGRTLEELHRLFEVDPRFDDLVLGTEYHDDEPLEVLFVKCAGSVVPSEVSSQIAASGFGLRTRPGVNSDTIIAHVIEDTE